METHDPSSGEHTHGPASEQDPAHAHLHDHSPTRRGRLFFWGGLGAGLVLVVLLLTHGFGLFGG